MNFISFFHTATGNEPYEYQIRLAGSDDGCPCESLLINIPTGLGKTAAVVLAWLWNRVQRKDAKWPRRLVYCLPMRTLVEQTRDEAGKWIENLARAFPENNGELRWLAEHSPIILMGGEDAGDWDIHPECPAILIGTQDMLLSRALNRGYGMSRYRWPMHFGLLNNDCLWVLDETQLMGVGVETSAQLDGFRHLAQWANLAHWSSLVQRFGRCNRRGDLNDTAEILWIDIQPKDAKDDQILPYSADELENARETISGLSDAGPQSLADLHVSESLVIRLGAVYLIDAANGGYDDDLGWTGERKNKPTPCLTCCSSDHSQATELREAHSPYPEASPSLSPSEQTLVADLVADGLAIQDKFRPEPLYNLTGKGHYASNTVEEIRKAKESKPKGDKL